MYKQSPAPLTYLDSQLVLCYSSYDYLREHFRAEHFLCEEGGCVEEKFTSVFRSEIDLRGEQNAFEVYCTYGSCK